MAAAAGKQRPFKSALPATLEDLELSFSLRKEQRTAQVILKKGRCVGSFADQIRQKFNLSTSSAAPWENTLVGCSAILLHAEGI